MNADQRNSTLWDERNVGRRVLQFGRCLDIGDWHGWRACFTDRITIDFKRLMGQDPIHVDAQAWTNFVELALSPIRRHHTYTNIVVELDDDCAHAMVYMTARHWASTDLGVSHNTQYGWYDFYLVRSLDDWLITGYKHDFQWVDGNAGVLDIQQPELLSLSEDLFTPEHFAAALMHPLK